MAFRGNMMPMPYLSKLKGEIQPGQTIFLKGHMSGSTRFDISFHLGPKVTGASRDDIALCLSARLDEGKFVANSFKNGEWGKDEKHKLNIKQGDHIDVRIRAREDYFELWSQGKDFGKFEYRMPLTHINHIYVVGEIELHRCAWEGRYYPIPFQTALPGHALSPGKSVYIAGAVEKKAEGFELDIKAGNGDYLLHFNPRFNKKEVIRNSCRGGTWDDVEERDGEFPFGKERAFDVYIVCEEDQYKIYVDGSEFCVYRHRLPPQTADNLVIQGDVEVHGIHW